MILADHWWSLSYLSTRSIVHAVPSAVFLQSAVVIALTICENKFLYPHIATISLSFLVFITRNANLHHHSCLGCFAKLRRRVYMQLFSNCVQSLSMSSLGRDLFFFFVQLSSRLGYVFKPAKISRQKMPQQGVLWRRFPKTWRPTASPARGHIDDMIIIQLYQDPIMDVNCEGYFIKELCPLVCPESWDDFF